MNLISISIPTILLLDRQRNGTNVYWTVLVHRGYVPSYGGYNMNNCPALFDKANGILIVLPDNAELTSEVSSYDMAKVKKIINLRLENK